MAQIAVRYADTAVFTSDNLRHESPEAILDQMAADSNPARASCASPTGAEAIRTAVMLSQPATSARGGQGPRNLSGSSATWKPFDDREEVRKAFDSFGK